MATKLLEEAFAEATKLPEREQDALAAMILEELASERRWEKAFAGSSDVLAQLADEALAEPRAGRIDKRILRLLRTLPPIVACIVWDVANENVTLKTIELADSVTEKEWEKYDIVRCIAAGNPEYPPVEEAQVLVEMMVEAWEYQVV